MLVSCIVDAARSIAASMAAVSIGGAIRGFEWMDPKVGDRRPHFNLRRVVNANPREPPRGEGIQDPAEQQDIFEAQPEDGQQGNQDPH